MTPSTLAELDRPRLHNWALQHVARSAVRVMVVLLADDGDTPESLARTDPAAFGNALMLTADGRDLAAAVPATLADDIVAHLVASLTADPEPLTPRIPGRSQAP